MATKLKCKQCGKVIEGLSKSQAEYNMMIHTIKCNKEKKNDKKM